MAYNYEAQTKYRHNRMKTYSLQVRADADADIVERLEAQDSKQGYIKKLIRADIANDSTASDDDKRKQMVQHLARVLDGMSYDRFERVLTDLLTPPED